MPCYAPALVESTLRGSYSFEPRRPSAGSEGFVRTVPILRRRRHLRCRRTWRAGRYRRRSPRCASPSRCRRHPGDRTTRRGGVQVSGLRPCPTAPCSVPVATTPGRRRSAHRRQCQAVGRDLPSLGWRVGRGCSSRCSSAPPRSVHVSRVPAMDRDAGSKRKPGVKLREKGKKESQVFTSVADNPRLCVKMSYLAPPIAGGPK